MKRNYQSWHKTKSTIETVAGRPFFHEREIWFCHLGANIGSEQDGQGEQFLRPIIEKAAQSITAMNRFFYFSSVLRQRRAEAVCKPIVLLYCVKSMKRVDNKMRHDSEIVGGREALAV